ncbi:MAG: phosphoribosyltransferase [Spirochaetales bacterium]|nr:phosphoribosyltransferase [Spirochaetales bacterium]
MKYYLSYNQIHKMVKSLAERIIKDGFNPDVIVAIGTGGFIPARMLKTFINRTILTVGISYYDENDKPKLIPETIQWIDEVERKLSGKKILLVDEVDDSRTTLEYCLNELLKYNPKELAVMVLHNKNKEKRGKLPVPVKRYYVGEEIDDLWICYPWDAQDIDEQVKLSVSGK